MATTELIATGTTAASSGDITVVAGTPVTVFLKKAADGAVDVNARAVIEQKSAGGTYHEIGALTGQYQARVIDGPGVFRVSRPLSTVAVGVDQS